MHTPVTKNTVRHDLIVRLSSNTIATFTCIVYMYVKRLRKSYIIIIVLDVHTIITVLPVSVPAFVYRCTHDANVYPITTNNLFRTHTHTHTLTVYIINIFIYIYL